MTLTIQIVNYNSRALLKECLNSIFAALPSGIEPQIVIVNNDAEPLPHFAMASGSKAELEIVEARKNLGFGRAHNLGFQKAKGELVLLLNPDTELQPAALTELLAAFCLDPAVGIVGPLLIAGENGKPEEHCGAKKTPSSIIRKKIALQSFMGEKEIFETDWVSGGALMVKKELFSKLGGFDENFFMYYEDVDFCLRAKKKDAKIIINPRAVILHRSGKSFASSREKKRHYYAAQGYYLRKNFGVLPALLVKILRAPFYLKNVYFGR